MKIEELKIVNIVYKGKIDRDKVNLNNVLFIDEDRFDVQYDPETFPGAMIKPKFESKVKNILLFSNGKFVINTTETVSKEEVEEVLKEIIEKSSK